MQKIFLTVLVLGFFTFAFPTSAKVTDHPFVASVVKLVQDIMPGEETPVPAEEFGEETDENFVDPREVQQALRELKDMKRELNGFAKELKKLANMQDDLAQINTMLEQVADFDARIRAEENLLDTLQEFRDAQMWDEVQKLRAKVEIPKEMRQWNQEIKRIDKLWKQKAVQSLNSDFGLNLEGAKAKIEEVKTGLAAVQDYYNSGDLESAMEAFDEMRQEFHPSEISSVLQRFQDLSKRLKMIKDQEVRGQIRGMLSEVIGYFNEGEYRVARETMDESFNEIAKIISQASSVGKKKGATKQGVLEMTNKLGDQMRSRAGEKKEQVQEMREQREVPRAQPAQPVQPLRQSAQPAKPAEPAKPMQQFPAKPARPAEPAQPTAPLRSAEPVRPSFEVAPRTSVTPISPAPAPEPIREPAPVPAPVEASPTQ